MLDHIYTYNPAIDVAIEHEYDWEFSPARHNRRPVSQSRAAVVSISAAAVTIATTGLLAPDTIGSHFTLAPLVVSFGPAALRTALCRLRESTRVMQPSVCFCGIVADDKPDPEEMDTATDISEPTLVVECAPNSLRLGNRGERRCLCFTTLVGVIIPEDDTLVRVVSR